MLGVLSLLPLLVAGQVLRIYVAEGPELRVQGEGQASSEVTIPAMRGAILDRAGRTLAVNAPRYDVALDPTMDGFQENADLLLRDLRPAYSDVHSRAPAEGGRAQLAAVRAALPGPE